MAGTVEQKLVEQGITLGDPRAPVANYVGFVRSGNLLFVSGQVCMNNDSKLVAKGKLGAGVTIEQGNAAARTCGINLLAQVPQLRVIARTSSFTRCAGKASVFRGPTLSDCAIILSLSRDQPRPPPQK